MSVSSCLPLNVPNSYPENFPHCLDLDETDALSNITYKEAIEAAQKAYLPYYAIAITESEAAVKDSAKKFYQIYDMAYLQTYANGQPVGSYLDPKTRKTVKKVHYFAVPCFALGEDEDQIFRPLDFANEKSSFQYIEVKNMDPNIGLMLIDSLNENIFATGSDDSKKKVRRIHYILGNLIKSGHLFSTKASSEERMKEALLWFWCSAKGGLSFTAEEDASRMGAVKLVECMKEAKFFNKYRTLLAQILQKVSNSWQPTLSSQEREAATRAKTLLREIGNIKPKIALSYATPTKSSSLPYQKH
jgi:hypothetical protein